jgi:carboxypeptidase family protein
MAKLISFVTMLLHPRIINVVFVTIAVSAAGLSSAADNKCIQGTVIGFNGKPCEGAEIRALRVEGKMWMVFATTDGHGVYVFKGLPVGAYSLTACVDGFPLSRANIRTQEKGWTKVDFDLRLETVEGMNQASPNLRNFIPNTNPH